MTTIYPWPGYVGKHYPKSGQVHPVALQRVVDSMPTFTEHPFQLLAGGSTIRSQTDAASDVNLLMILDVPPNEDGGISSRDFAAASEGAVKLVQMVKDLTQVVFDFFVEAKHYCTSGGHSLGFGYTQSLKVVGTSADWSETDLSYVVWPEDAPRVELEYYLSHKIRKLHRELSSSRINFGSEQGCEILADAIDVPFHVLRRLREWRVGDWSDCSRDNLLRLAHDEGWLSDSEAVYLRYLVALRQRYSSLLMEEETNFSAYTQLLGEIKMAGHLSLDFLRGLQNVYG